MVLDNEALYDICFRTLKLTTPSLYYWRFWLLANRIGPTFANQQLRKATELEIALGTGVGPDLVQELELIMRVWKCSSWSVSLLFSCLATQTCAGMRSYEQVMGMMTAVPTMYSGFGLYDGLILFVPFDDACSYAGQIPFVWNIWL